jgi:hypothetical protein
MTADPQTRFELYKLYLATAEKVSDRRQQANTWMLSVNSALVSLYGYLGATKEAVAPAEKAIWLIAIPIAGIILCLGWAGLLASYRQLNGAKFAVLHLMEAELGLDAFTRERTAYKAVKRRPLSRLEQVVPWSFLTLYLLLVAAAALFSGR